LFLFSSRRRHTRSKRDWSSDVCSSDLSMVGIIISVMLINLFESSGTFIAVTEKAGLADKEGRYPHQQASLFVDSGASALGTYMGTSAVTAFVESASGVAVGGRTGVIDRKRKRLNSSH